jgi:uncharacterized protein YecT (DUF1311 family)
MIRLPEFIAALLDSCFDALKGHGFSRAANARIKCLALAPEGCFSNKSSVQPISILKDSIKTSILHVSFILLAVIFLFNSIPCNSQVSAQLHSCEQKASFSQAEIISCANDEDARADSELNVVYRHLLSKAEKEPGATAKVKGAERAWIQYRDAYLEAMFPAEDKLANYGSKYPSDFNLVRASLSREQTNKLRELIKRYEGQ